ncbi:hypothetical protein IG631_15570 [Alternaria alternata]|nr:hypothetical protein IG631_15570 [Alternaria alternata]
MSGFGSNVCWPPAPPDLRVAGTAIWERSSMKSFTRKSLLCGSQCENNPEPVRLLTVNFSRVNWGARIDVLDVW